MTSDSTIQNEPISTTLSKEQERNPVTGQFLPGKSGNPRGRSKGSKNEITLLKRDVELALREQALEALPYILQKAIDLACKGDRTMIKLLIELHMSKAQSSDEEQAGKEKVTINIRDLTVSPDNMPKLAQEGIHDGVNVNPKVN